MQNYKHAKTFAAEPTRPMRIMNRLAGVSLLLSIALTSGCANYSRDHMTVGSIPDDYRTRHPIIVSENENAEDIVITAGSNRLSQRGRDIVRSMGLKYKTSGAKSIAILIPTGSSNETSARSAANDAVAELQQLGITSSQIVIQHYNASSHGASASLRIVYSDLVASIDSQCGKWDEDILSTSENKNYANFGCASQNNLAQQIANPADLLGPRGMSEIDSTKRTKVIEDWRESSTDLAPL
jgi:pilus assembly protein CpaD